MGLIKKTINTLRYYSRLLTSIEQQLQKMNNGQSELSNMNTIISNENKKILEATLLNSEKKVMYDFTIVTACFNNEQYIDKYFYSIISQNYDLRKIQIIVIDDGSTDDTKLVIERWKEYPHINLEYYYQRNTGQALARNNGIEHIKNEWVTFIDMDDFISDNYFTEVNNAINKYGNRSGMYINQWTSYYEETGEYLNNHPLNYRFKNIGSSAIFNLKDNPNYFYYSASSSFFNANLIGFENIRFKDIRPNFEDANFIMTYLQKTNTKKVTFIGDTEYFYRKRADLSSTIDKSKTDKNRYVKALYDAYIVTLEQYEEGKIPNYVQRAIIYDMQWNFEGFSAIRGLFTEEEIDLRFKYLTKIYKKISYINVIAMKKIVKENYLILISKEFYNNTIKPEITYILEEREYILYKIVGDRKSVEQLFINGFPISQIEHSEKILIFGTRNEIIEQIVKIDKQEKNVIQFMNETLDIHKTNIGYTDKFFDKNAKIIFFDRMDKADDNAETLYEWFMKNKPDYKNIRFAIKRDAKDWERLLEKGFNLIPYGEKEFDDFYEQADFILASGADDSIHNYKRFRYFWYRSNAKFIFLQHGITTDDISPWLYGKRLNQTVIATNIEKKEFKSIQYSIFDEQIIMSGFPRFDKLYCNAKNKIILQLTWRKEYEDYTDEQFEKTEYYKRISEILTDEEFYEKLIVRGFKISLVLHPNVFKHYNIFTKFENDLVEIIQSDNVAYRDIFASGKIMITDYSSVFADFCYLGKPVIHYQFDKKSFYTNHTYKESMNYEKEGLGPVVYNFGSLKSQVIQLIENNCAMEEVYMERANNFYVFRDRENSKRVFELLDKKYGRKL